MNQPANFDGDTAKIDPDDSVLLLIDHQAGLLQLVKDIDVTELRHHVTALSKVAYKMQIPTFTTASVPDGPNGPLIDEIHDNNPDATYIPRQGQISAWDVPDFVQAIEKTGRKTLIIAGTLTSVCLAFPAIDAVKAGYRVFGVVDASGNWSQMATDLTIARVAQSGVVPIDTYAAICHIMGTWNREDGQWWAQLMADDIVPKYANLISSYNKAQQIQKDGPETVLDQS